MSKHLHLHHLRSDGSRASHDYFEVHSSLAMGAIRRDYRELRRAGIPHYTARGVLVRALMWGRSFSLEGMS